MAKDQRFASFVALGDSFTEGLGDELPTGNVRGWADRVAEALSFERTARGLPPLTYANLAVRGRKALEVIEEQVPVAVSMGADLLSFNAGGNDMLRPNFDPHPKLRRIFSAVRRLTGMGSHVVLLAGPNAGHNLPLGNIFTARGTLYTEIATEESEKIDNLTFVDNFSDEGFKDSSLWSEDGLHLSPAGHLRVAANVLDRLQVAYPPSWGDPREVDPDPKSFATPTYARRYVLPWIGRRLTGRSSGDGRSPKRPNLEPFQMEGATGETLWWRPPEGGRV